MLAKTEQRGLEGHNITLMLVCHSQRVKRIKMNDKQIINMIINYHLVFQSITMWCDLGAKLLCMATTGKHDKYLTLVSIKII